MAESRTARMGQPQYSSDLDEWSLDDFNEAWLAVENRAARYVGQGATGARPAAAAQYVGGFWWNTTTGRLDYCNATPAWVSIGDPLAPWPVGSIFTSYLATNPVDQLGGGTWVRFGEGRVLLSQSGADVDFDTAGDTGGEKTHVLTTAEMPSHTHTVHDNADNYVDPATAVIASGLNNFSQTGEVDSATGAEGGGQAHNNMPPFVVVYVWRRTA